MQKKNSSLIPILHLVCFFQATRQLEISSPCEYLLQTYGYVALKTHIHAPDSTHTFALLLFLFLFLLSAPASTPDPPPDPDPEPAQSSVSDFPSNSTVNPLSIYFLLFWILLLLPRLAA